MRSFLTHTLCVALGALAFWGYLKGRGSPVVVKEFDSIDEVGIRPGDLLLSVNGVNDHSMFNAMAEGFKKGDVCVVLERNSKKREVCLKRS